MKQIFVLLSLLISSISYSQTTWKPESYEISFKIKNAGITVTGRFTGLKTDLKFSPDKLGNSHLNASVEVATIKTGIGKRDDDLQKETYFNSGKYKLIEIKSVKLYKKGDQYEGSFNVTIKGVTKQVEIPFGFDKTGNEAHFKGGFTINRRDFGVGGKTMTMSEHADVSIDIKAKS